jgi:hypothetical protein
MATQPKTIMYDLIYIGITFAFFVIAAAYAKFCEIVR